MRKTLYAVALCGVIALSGCAMFERPVGGGPSPAEVSVSTGAETFSKNVGTGTPVELVYAAISALTAGGLAGFAAYKKGKKKGQENGAK